MAFFDLILHSTGDEVADDPTASLNAYIIAADAMRSSMVPPTREALGDKLEEYSILIGRLKTPGKLLPAELETVRSLQKFFTRLAQQGEAEIYEGTFDLEPPFIPMSLVSG